MVSFNLSFSDPIEVFSILLQYRRKNSARKLLRRKNTQATARSDEPIRSRSFRVVLVILFHFWIAYVEEY